MLGKTNSSVGGKVNNQDLYITDNGVYTAGEGFTGLGVVEVNVPKGEQVTAINKTGTVITTGQKVWLNENAQIQGSNYNLANLSVTDASYVGLISRTGNFGWCANKLYSIGSDTATYISDLSTKNGYLFKYMDNGSVFKCYGANCQGQATRVDENAQYILDTAYPLSGNLFYRYTTGDYTGNVQEINLNDGSVIKTYKVGYSSAKIPWAVINGKIYTLESNARRWTLNEDLTTTQDTYTFENATTLYAAGTTIDNRYVIAATDEAFSVGAADSYLRLVEVIDENTLKCLTQSEMPEDLQEFYSKSCRMVFNPYTGILTVSAYGGLSYAVMKYENGTWTKLPVDLGLENYPNKFLQTVITVSDDLSRACVGIGATPYNLQPYIINLTSTSGYTAVPYRFYNVTENTITGYAGNETEADGEVIVGVGSVPSVNNGGNGGGNYDPTTPPLEEVPFNDSYIDTDKIVSVGRVFNTDRNEPTAVDLANLTENSGFTQYSNSLFTSEDKSLADEFLIRFHLSDRVGDGVIKSQFIYLFGHNTASDGGNWWDETDRSDQFAMMFGFDSEWNYRTVGVNVGFVDENGYHTPNTRVDIGGELQFGWDTIKMYYNNDVQSWVLAFGDNFANEYPIPELPKVCKPYNLISLVDVAGYGDNCIDLAETGFKLNGEWVYRCVKQI